LGKHTRKTQDIHINNDRSINERGQPPLLFAVMAIKKRRSFDFFFFFVLHLFLIFNDASFRRRKKSLTIEKKNGMQI